MGMRPLSSGSRSRRACRDHSDPVAPAFTGSSCGRAPGSHGTATPRSSWHSAWLDSISGEAEFACGRDGRHRNRGGRRASFRRDPGSRPAHSPHVWGLFTPQRKLRADPGTRELGRHVRAAAGRNLLVGLEVPLPDADELTNGNRCRQPISLARRAPSAMHHGYGSNPVPRAAWLACSDRDRHRMDPHGRGPLGQRLHQEMPSRLLGSGRSALGRSWLVRRRTAVNETGPFGYGMSRLTPPSVIACSGRL
jgi:hypothetical protein